MNLAIFASGNGSNFQAIAEAVADGSVSGEIVFLFSDNPKSFAVERARKLKIPTLVFSPNDFLSKEAYETNLLQHLNEKNSQLIVLAGYMRIVGLTLLEAFPHRIINIHPSLLPQFPGRNGIQEAFEANIVETGVTVHYVDKGVDTGPIIQQEKVLIHRKDTLASLEKKIHQIEHRLYPEVLAKIINQNEGARLDDKKKSTNQCL